MKKCIILANGKAPKKNVITFLQKHNYTTLICADGGANSALKMKLIPDVIVGDLDSISLQALASFKDKSEIIQLKRQNDTDVEKCLKYAINKGSSEAVLLAVTGNRLDHTFCNLGIVIKYFNELKLKVIAEESLLIPYTGKVELNTTPGEIISLYGLDKETRIYSRGLKYPLKNVSLPFGEKESTSNKALTEKVSLRIKGGIIFIVRNFNTAKLHAFS